MVWASAAAAAASASRARTRRRARTASIIPDGAVIEGRGAVRRHSHRPERPAVAAGEPPARAEALAVADLELGLVGDRHGVVVGDGEAMILPVAALGGLLERDRHSAGPPGLHLA